MVMNWGQILPEKKDGWDGRCRERLPEIEHQTAMHSDFKSGDCFGNCCVVFINMRDP